MKNTINAFSKGINTDLHPLVTGKDLLTDALNATFITHNGNEFILQNDMGNTLIQDSTTGAIMGIKEGFIPIGMKEHGGILYIASFNPTTKEGELGSIPSPVFNYTFNTLPDTRIFNDGIALYNLPSEDTISIHELCTNEFIPVNDAVLSVGDFFFLNLNFLSEGDSFNKVENIATVLHDEVTGAVCGINSSIPFFLINPVVEDSSIGPGIFDIVLYARSSKNSSYIPIQTNTPCLLDSNDQNRFWFRMNEGNKAIDEVQYQSNRVFRAYPNIRPGSLFIQLKLRDIYTDFQFIKNSSTELNSPYYYYEYQ